MECLSFVLWLHHKVKGFKDFQVLCEGFKGSSWVEMEYNNYGLFESFCNKKNYNKVMFM